MSIENTNTPGGNNGANTSDGNNKQEQEEIQISQPKIERPDGPFEHSGETSGWTEEEKIEKEGDDGA
jgi:hypothetical protein